MNIRHGRIALAICVTWLCSVSLTPALELEYAGSQANIGGTFFPGGSLPYVTVPWRTSMSANIFATSDEFPNQYYGREGYALFATTFSYPNANAICCDANIDPNSGDPLFPNLVQLPTWVAESQILAERMAGGYGYSLIDDPQLMFGERYWSFDGASYPPPTSTNGTGQNPWVKMGFLDGPDVLGNNTTEEPTARWGFTVGAGAPAAFRVGVMTGGMDNENFVPDEVFIQQYEGPTPVGAPLGTGALSGPLRDRFVDMHFFDILGAEEGDLIVFGVMAGANSFGNAGVAGFSFDVLAEAPGDADFNSDGDVDGQDFLMWQRGESPQPLSPADLALWQAEFGGGAIASGTSIPEPAALALGLIGLAAIGRRKRN